MNISFHPLEEAGSVVDCSTILKTFRLEGLDVHVAEYMGRDVIWFQTMDGQIGHIESDNQAYGGSSHDHARAARRTGVL